MERKYYLRGLGLGIAVTAIILSVVVPRNRGAMTNDEIMARAKELGMVENTVLSDTRKKDVTQENMDDSHADEQDAEDQLQNDLAAGSAVDIDSESDSALTETDEDVINETEENPETDNDEQDDANSENVVGEENSEPEALVGEETQDDVNEPAEVDTETKNVNETVTSTTVKVITIKSGDSSYTVSKKLADVGVVTSAQNFDTYLCQNGYDKRLHTGTFSIPPGASDEQIARIVTGLE